MQRVFTETVRRYGKSETLYLDNGSTYRAETLQIACKASTSASRMPSEVRLLLLLGASLSTLC